MKIIPLFFLLASACTAINLVAQDINHLFILSGQSNMAGLRPNESFTPAVARTFGIDDVIVVKDAVGGQPIRRWYQGWEPPEGNTTLAKPDLYDSLMHKVYPAINGKEITSITFIWMQGERDAREELGAVYEESLLGLYHQLSEDLGRDDINFVIGRLSDFDMGNEKYPHWTKIREIQVKVAESNPRFAWIDTDDLNDGINRQGKSIRDDLHMSAEGYVIMGERFAEKAVELIRKYERLFEQSSFEIQTEKLVQLMDQRLEYMKPVAAFKFRHGLPLEDLEQEHRVLSRAKRSAHLMGLDTNSIEPFLQWQISQAKELQQGYFAEWKESPDLFPENVPDLQDDLRPKIAQTSQDILDVLAQMIKGGDSLQDLEASFFFGFFDKYSVTRKHREDLISLLRSIH